MALLSEHLAEGVGDVHDVDIGGVDARFGQGLVHQLAGQIGEIATFAGQITGEIALVTAQYPDISGHMPKITTVRASAVPVCRRRVAG